VSGIYYFISAYPLIFEACKDGRYFLLGADCDWPGWNMSLVLNIARGGQIKGRRTSEHLGELIEYYITTTRQFEDILKEEERR
jgi:hypothetical protein